MKNFTLLWRSLSVAVFFLFASGLSAQQSCNLDPNLIEISVENTCTDGGTIDQPYVTIDFGSVAVDGMTEITIESFFLNNLNLGTYTFTVEVVFGFATFELPGFAIGTPNNFVRLNEVEDLENGCTQTFGAGDVESNFYSLTTTSALNVVKDNSSSIDPPCSGIPTGKLSVRVSPTDGNFNPNRFSMAPGDVRLVPSSFSTFISVIPPGTFPNPNQAGTGYYIVETNQSLVSGDYTLLLYDNVRGCEVSFETTIGDAANEFGVSGNAEPVTCFGEFDGSIEIVPENAVPVLNGFLNYALRGPNNLLRLGTIAASNGVYNSPTESNLEAGEYQLSLTATNGGCTAETTVIIESPDEIIVNDLAVEPICADEGTFVITASSITGIDANATYRLIDGSQIDPLVFDNGCWDRSSAPISAGLQNDGSYEFTRFTPGIGFCLDIDRDTVVTVYMEVEVESSTQAGVACVDTFQFDVQIDAQPATPVISLSATNLLGDPAGPAFCSNQDVTVSVDNYEAVGFTYEITYTPVTGVIGVDDFANTTFAYTGPGSVVGSFNNTTNFQQNINFEVTATNDASGCTSIVESFTVPVRPQPVLDPIFPSTAVVCSDEAYTSPAITLNDNGTNGNVRFDYSWTLNGAASPDFTIISTTGGTGLSGGAQVTGRFVNTTGVAQTATLTITPTFPQFNNDCAGEAAQIVVTVSPRPSLNYDLTIGSLDTMLSSPDVASFEICNGEDFLLDNLNIPEDHAGNKAKYVSYSVRGDARFLQINTNGANFGPTDVQTTQFLPIDNFAIGQPNIQNNHPSNNAQVAEIILTPYFEDELGSPDFPLCAGQPIRLFLTLNPTPPMLPSPQSETVCSDERIEYTILGASGSGTNLETRITATNIFSGTTEGMFVVPEGANRIENFRFELTGGNGGATTTTGGAGGLGAFVTGTLSDTELLPGDTVRIRKGLAGGANNRNGDGGDASFLTVTRGTSVIYTFVAAGGGGAGSAEDGQDGQGFTMASAGDGAQGQGPGGFGGTGFNGSPVAGGGLGNINGGGGGGGWVGGDGGDSQVGESGEGGFSFSDPSTAPASFALKADTDLPDGEVNIFYTVVYDDVRFTLANQTVPAGLTPTGEILTNGEVDTILFGQQFENLTDTAITVSYVFNTSTEAMCDNGGQVTVDITVEPKPTATISGGSTTMVTGNATDGFEATVCSGDEINAILNSLTVPSTDSSDLYFEVSTVSTLGTGTFGNDSQAASNSTDFGGNNSGFDLPIDFFETGVVNNTGTDGTITYTITPYIGDGSTGDCAGDPITFTVTVQPGFAANNSQPVVDVCSREELNTVFDLEASQSGSINISFDEIRVEGFRVINPSADFTISGLDTTGLAAGGFMLNATGNFFNDAAFTNRTGGGVTVEIDVVFISDTGCESLPVTYEFLVRAEPIIDESNAAALLCEGDVTGLSVMPATNSAFANSFSPTNVTFSYELDAGNLTYTGSNVYPLTGGATMFSGDTFDNPTSMPQTATYTVVATTRFGCASQPVTYEVTVLPDPELELTASQGSTTIDGQEQLAAIETLTICSGSTVDFGISQDVTGTGVSYRIQRVVTGSVTNGDGSPVDNFEGALPVANFQETLINTGTAAATVQYNVAAYTYGPDELDGEGLNASDDCVGLTQRVIIEILPDNSDPSDLVLNYFRDGSFVNPTPTVDTVCAGTTVAFGPGTPLDVSDGMNVRYSITNDGGLPAVTGTGNNPFANNGINFFGQFSEVLVNESTAGITYTVLVELYSFGTNGTDDDLSGDDCVGTTRTVTIFVEPQPVLNANLTVGAQTVVVESGEDYFFELCSGDDFRLGDLAFLTDDLASRANLVSFSISGASASEFLNLGTQNGQLLAIDGFLIGSNDVRNTSGAPYIAEITLVPFYDDLSTIGQADDCSGEEINITVVLNPEVTGVTASQSATFCSGEDTRFQIMGGTNTFESVVVLGSDFETTQEVVFPVGAARIEGISFEITGANGGDATQSNTTGGVGVRANGMINDGDALPGDTIRVIKGTAGGSGTLAGDGGGGSALLLIGGPMRAANFQGVVIDRVVVAGGGGAGLQENSVTTLQNTTLDGPGANGAGPGGNGGQNGPSYVGGTGANNGGGGGGGRVGGDGGDSQSGNSGAAGQSFLFSSNNPVGSATASLKEGTDAEDGEASISYKVVFDDIQFTVASKTVATGLVPAATGLVMGSTGTDTLLYDENFTNPTDGALDVVYTLNTATEANCPGGQVTVTLTIEPNPTLDFAGNGTIVSDDGDGNYSAAICSGDGLSATISSDVIPSNGASFLRARVIRSMTGAGTLTFDASDANAASQTTFFNGLNQPSVADVDFFETAINYTGTDTATLTYQIIPVIINSSSSGAECFGDTITFTVSVFPEFMGVNQGPIQNNICSDISLEDAGFDLSTSQPMTVAYDSIIIDTVKTTAGMNVNFDTVTSVYNGTPVTVLRSEGFFNDDVYRNRTGAPVFVTYTVRLVSGPGCTSEPIDYEFRYTAEPVIDIVESATNQIDTTICSGDMTGLTVTPAANSAFPGTTGANSFQSQITIEYDIIEQPAGLVLSNSTDGYPFTAGRNYFRDDVWTNNTAGPLDVKYSVKVSNGSCAGDSVVYTVTVNPNPFADVTLISQDSTETFGLSNSRLFLTPNPQFGVCSGQAIAASVPSVSTAAEGTLMVDFQVSVDADGISGYPVGTTYTFPAGELADSLSYAAGELVNMAAASQFFTVEYRAYVEANGIPGFQNDGIDCRSDGTIQFDVVLNPVNEAEIELRVSNGTNTPIPVTDSLCSGTLFDLAVKALNNNPDPAIDSFVVSVAIPSGLVAGPGTFVADTTLLRANFGPSAVQTAAQFTRLVGLSFTNMTPGIKTVTYTATPYTGDCAGIPDTTTISYRAEIELIANESVICADPGVSTSLFAIDENGGMISNDPLEYRYRYIGGTAVGYTLQAGDGTGLAVFVFDPTTQANAVNLEFEDQRGVLVTPSPNSANFTPGTVDFQVVYDDTDNGCGVITDTITLNFQTTAEAGMANQALGILCDEVNFILSDAIIGGDPNGVFTFTNGDPGLGALNGANFTPMVGGSDPAPVAIDFTYTVGGGNSGCAVASVDFTILVEPAPNAGTLNMMADNEACQSALAFNLFDLIDGAMPGGTFTQTAGVDFVNVAADGVFDQNSVSAGTYVFDYEVTSANGCGSDVLNDITVLVLAQTDCSTPVPCDTINLLAGFNVISFDVLPGDMTVENIFADDIAADNLLSIFSINPDTRSSEVYSFNPVFGTTNNTIGSIRDGLGYIVEVDQPTQIITCGIAADTSLRVELISSLNIVGYTKPETQTARNYFRTIISNGDINQIRTVTEAGVFQRLRFNPLNGSNIRMTNSRGYLLDMTADYAPGSWRDDAQAPTSNFDRLFGYTNISEEFAGQFIRFVDADGNVYGKVAVAADGTYDNMILFGDLVETDRLVEGPAAGEELYAEFRGETIATGMTFNGNWNLRQLDLNFVSMTTPVVVLSDDFKMDVFPNPTEGLVMINLSLDQDYETVRVEVYSAIGQLLVEREIDGLMSGRHSVELNLEQLPAGSYHIRVLTEAGLKGHQQLIRR